MLNKKQIKFIESTTRGKHTPVNAGHMLYVRAVVDHPSNPWFIKAHDPGLFTDLSKSSEAERYLKKEFDVYNHLRENDFSHLPDSFHYDHEVLLLTGLSDRNGWHWKVPKGQEFDYINAALSAIEKLENIPVHTMFDKEPSLEHFWETGWGSGQAFEPMVDSYVTQFRDALRPDSLGSLKKLSKNLDIARPKGKIIPSGHTSHFDMRQSNIAWHQSHGIVFVDWSWASHGYQGADSTMLLIDLHKSGIDVSKWLDSHFSDEFAKLLVGYWLSRVTQPSAEGNHGVRLQQLVSAIAASELLGIKRV